MARAGGPPDLSFGPGSWMPGGWTGVLRSVIAEFVDVGVDQQVYVLPPTTSRLLIANLTFKDSPNHQYVDLCWCTGHAVYVDVCCRLQLYASHTEVLNVSILAPSSSPNTASTIVHIDVTTKHHPTTAGWH